MRKRYKIGLVIISIFIIVVLILGFLKFTFKKEEKPKNASNVISNIKKYNYTLDDRDTKYMKDTFQELTKILDNDEIDEIKYADAIAKLFIIDFYTLNNKINKYDVGALEYILNSKVDNFKIKAMDTIYKDIIDNTYKDRIQKLPEVTNVEILDILESTYKVGDKDYEAYKVTLNISYKEDLGYDKEGTIYLVKNNEKLEVASYNPVIEE